MYLIVIAWMYVVLMMSVAEATSSTGTLLGALVTLVLYGVGPVMLVVYLMGAPARSKAIKKREAEARAQAQAQAQQSISASEGAIPATVSSTVVAPDAGSHSSGGGEAIAANAGIAPVGKKP